MFVQLKTVHIFQQSRQRGRNCAVTEVQVQLPRQWWQSLVPVLLPSGQSRLPGSSFYLVYKETFCNSKWNQRNVSISTRISFWTPTSCPEATLHCMFISIIYNINNYSNFIAFQATKQSWISSGRGVERNSYIWGVPPEELHLGWVDVTFLGDFSCLSWAPIICNQAEILICWCQTLGQ